MTDWTTLNEIFVPSMCVLLFLLAMLMCCGILRRVVRYRRQNDLIRDAEKLLEESRALTAEDQECRASVPNYSWNDLQRDLHDKGITFNEIWDKCGGRLPTKPVKEEALPGPSGQGGRSSDIEGIGIHGTSDVEALDRKAKLEAWFNERTKESGELKVVGPPPGPIPVISIEGQHVRCSYCGGTGRYSGNAVRFGTHRFNGGYAEAHRIPKTDKCEACGGSGFVIVTKG